MKHFHLCDICQENLECDCKNPNNETRCMDCTLASVEVEKEVQGFIEEATRRGEIPVK